MKGALKWLVISISAVIMLGVAAVITLPLVINPNDYRDSISTLVHKETGMTLTINGDIGWSVFPWLGLSLNDLKIDDTRQKPLGTLKHAAVQVKLLPLLSKRLDISTLELSGLTLNMVVDQQGRANWMPATPAANTQAQSRTSGSAETSAQSSAPALSGLSVSGITINDISVSYRDIPAGQTISLRQARLETGPVSQGQPFDLQASFEIENNNPALAALISLKGRITPPENATGKLIARDLTLKVTPLNVNNPATLALTGSLQATGNTIEGSAAIDPVDLSQLMQQFNMPLPPMNGADQVLRKVSFSTNFKKQGNSLSLTEVAAAVDKFQLQGSIAVTNLNTSALSFNLTGNDLVVDPYLPATAKNSHNSGDKGVKTAPASTPASAAGATEPVIIPVAVIQKLNVKGKARLNSLTMSGLVFEKPTLEVNAANGHARITRLNAGFYQGVIDASAGVDTRGTLAKQPTVSARADIKAINIAALAEQVVNLEPLVGQASANLRIVSHGLTKTQLTKTLNGEAEFNIADGALKGSNFDKMVCEVVARVRKKSLSKTDWPEQTAFRTLGGSVKIIDGIARNRDLDAALDNINLKGDGVVNLPQETIDYHLGLTITGANAEQGDPACRINKKYADISWPVRCHGKLGDSGLCGIDEQRLGDTLAQLAEKEVTDQLKKKLEDKLGEKLKGWFK